jgi:hypothetical protein
VFLGKNVLVFGPGLFLYCGPPPPCGADTSILGRIGSLWVAEEGAAWYWYYGLSSRGEGHDGSGGGLSAEWVKTILLSGLSFYFFWSF